MPCTQLCWRASLKWFRFAHAYKIVGNLRIQRNLTCILENSLNEGFCHYWNSKDPRHGNRPSGGFIHVASLKCSLWRMLPWHWETPFFRQSQQLMVLCLWMAHYVQHLTLICHTYLDIKEHCAIYRLEMVIIHDNWMASVNDEPDTQPKHVTHVCAFNVIMLVKGTVGQLTLGLSASSWLGCNTSAGRERKKSWLCCSGSVMDPLLCPTWMGECKHIHVVTTVRSQRGWEQKAEIPGVKLNVILNHDGHYLLGLFRSM